MECECLTELHWRGLTGWRDLGCSLQSYHVGTRAQTGACGKSVIRKKIVKSRNEALILYSVSQLGCMNVPTLDDSEDIDFLFEKESAVDEVCESFFVPNIPCKVLLLRRLYLLE